MYTKKLHKLFYFNILGISGLFAAPNFEFWNKLNKPVYISVGDKNNSPYEKTFKKVDAGKWTDASQQQTPSGYDINTQNETILLLSTTMPDQGTEIYEFKINPGKTVYARVKDASGSLGFGPQTGPLLGFMGKTERGYPLSGNFKASDFKTSNVKFQPAMPKRDIPVTKPNEPVKQVPILSDKEKKALQVELGKLEKRRKFLEGVLSNYATAKITGQIKEKMLDEDDAPLTEDQFRAKLNAVQGQISSIRERLGLVKETGF